MATFPLYAPKDPSNPHRGGVLAGLGDGPSPEGVVYLTTLNGDPAPEGDYFLRGESDRAALPITVGAGGRVVSQGERLVLPW